MKVALVQRNSPLEIVTNLHSKRRTEQMVLFDQNTRFYGADANSMAARKPDKIPAGMSVMLGREAEHPTVKVGKTLSEGEVMVYFLHATFLSGKQGCGQVPARRPDDMRVICD